MTLNCKECKKNDICFPIQLSLFESKTIIKKEKEMNEGFIIKVTENEPKLYLNKLLKVLEDTTLTVEPTNYIYTGPKAAKKGQYILVKTRRNEDYDVELTNELVRSGYPGFYYPMYDLVMDFNKISKCLEEYKKFNFTPNCANCPLMKEFENNLLSEIFSSVLGVYSKNTSTNKVYDGEWITTNSKLQIFRDHVKIGYDIFEIYTTRGNEYIYLDNHKVYIGKNWLGEKYLTV